MSSPGSQHGSPQPAPALDTLVTYFVAAKKALTVTTHVYQANEIVEDARKLIEEETVLKAKNTYVRTGIGEQLNVLRSIHSGLESVGAEAQADFQAVVRSIDVANDRLQVTLASLRKTIVSSALAASSETGYKQGESSNDESSAPAATGKDKTLYDFIDDTTHTSLLETLRTTIDAYNDNQTALHQVRSSLSDALQETSTVLAGIDALRPHTGDVQEPDISMPDLFRSLNTNATEMASLLQSLISHHDLCITALKHTEGGGEAALAATSSPEPLMSGTHSPTEASLYAGAATEASRAPISALEREEMLAVLTTDAAQVDDVVLEIRERAEEMRASLASLTLATTTTRQRFAALQDLLSGNLAVVQLGGMVSAATEFRTTWAAQRETLVEGTEQLAELARFHDSFVASYAGLLREVERRRLVEGKMEKVASRAMREIEALQAEDEDMRSVFVREVGEWLPRDIWPGLMEGTARWELRREKGRSLELLGGGGGSGEIAREGP